MSKSLAQRVQRTRDGHDDAGILLISFESGEDAFTSTSTDDDFFRIQCVNVVAVAVSLLTDHVGVKSYATASAGTCVVVRTLLFVRYQESREAPMNG